jgi:hypothetical protein
MTIEITGIRIDSPLRARIVGALTQIVDHECSAPVDALVAFFDDDGPKNGPAIRCAITVKWPHATPVHVEHRGSSSRLAFNAAFTAVMRRVREETERARDLKRRPKKYFAARRLLTSEQPAASIVQ